MAKHYQGKIGHLTVGIPFFVLIGFTALTLTSCYSYDGPVRAKPTKAEIKLPPPEPKVFAEPVSKKGVYQYRI